MYENSYQLELDHLALGLTRQPTFMGVNVKVFFANMIGCTLICIDAHTFLGVPLFVVLHLTSAQLSIKEPNFLFIWIKAFVKTPPTLNSVFWGLTNSYEPW